MMKEESISHQSCINLNLRYKLILSFTAFLVAAVVFVFLITYNIYSNIYQEKLFKSNTDTVKNVNNAS